MKGRLRRCRSAMRAHVRASTFRAQGSPSALRPTAKNEIVGSPRRGHPTFPEQAPGGAREPKNFKRL